MICLGFETSGPFCAAALTRGGDVIAERFEPLARGQSERLTPLLQELLDEAATDWADVERIGVGTGPGNFTGIRISVAAARGLALGLGIPAIGVSRFDVIRAWSGGAGLPAVPAPRDQVYISSENKDAAMMPLDEAKTLGPLSYFPEDENPARLIAQIAATQTPNAPRPAPLYIKAADAAPPRDAPPRIIP